MNATKYYEIPATKRAAPPTPSPTYRPRVSLSSDATGDEGDGLGVEGSVGVGQLRFPSAEDAMLNRPGTESDRF